MKTMNLNNRLNKHVKGFTLIELMIVVAIIGILAAIALPAYKDYVAKADASAAVASMSGSKVKVSEVFSVNGAFSCTDTSGGTIAYCAADDGVLSTVSGNITATLTPSEGGAGASAGEVIWTCTLSGTGAVPIKNCTAS